MNQEPPSARDLRLQVGGLSIAALEWNPTSPTKVLALHGWMDNAASFVPLAAHLDTLHLVAMDFSGHGLSGHHPASCHPTILDWVPEVLGAADALGWPTFRILSHSLGAAIGLLVAAVAPTRVERLVLLDGYGPISEAAEKSPQRLANALQAERKIRERREKPCRSFDDAVRARGISGPDLTPEALGLLVRRGTEPCSGGVRFRHDPRLATPSRTRLTEAQVQAFLKAVKSPVLAVRPRNGWPIPDEVLQSRLACLAHSEHREVDGGHHVHLTHPERVAEAIGVFLRGC
jgi:pimeloyl-ACP methyl ester carboxylesterase